MTDYDDDGLPVEDCYDDYGFSEDYLSPYPKEEHKVTKIGSIFDESGEYETVYYLVKEIVDQEWVNAKFPSYHCQHSYDCCANWYPRTGRIVGTDGGNTIVCQSWAMNV